MAKIEIEGKTEKIINDGFEFIKIIDCPDAKQVILYFHRGTGGNQARIDKNEIYKIAGVDAIHFENTFLCTVEYKFI